jgi:hypothetical protein
MGAMGGWRGRDGVADLHLDLPSLLGVGHLMDISVFGCHHCYPAANINTAKIFA